MWERLAIRLERRAGSGAGSCQPPGLPLKLGAGLCVHPDPGPIPPPPGAGRPSPAHRGGGVLSAALQHFT